MIKKIYISLPISGHPIEEAKERAKKLASAARSIYPDAEVITPFDVCTEPDKPYSYYMGEDIKAILECDAVLFAEDWRNSEGCTLERHAATIYKKAILQEYEDNLETLNHRKYDTDSDNNRAK